MLCFLGKCFKYLVVTPKKGNQPIQCRVRGELSDSCDDAHHSQFSDVQIVCARHQEEHRVPGFSRSPFQFGPVPWRGHFIAGYSHPDVEVSQQGMAPASGRKMWGEKHKL